MSERTSAGPEDDQRRLIRSLANPALHGESCTQVRVIETHISYVLLTGRFAYKIKKPVDLGFLDFTTLPARHFYCERELELNRRLAPAIYLQVVAITGTIDDPRIGGDGLVLEYAVQMREFPQEGLLTHVLERGDLHATHIDALASVVAAFHLAAPAADVGSRFGSATTIRDLAIENFTEINPLVDDEGDRRTLADLRCWTEREHALRARQLTERQRRGFVRECHGDLHLGNIALVDGNVTIFDCVEFNEDMRWSDVMADVAFLVMDLEDRGRPEFAARFLNAYLERTGDYDGIQVLRFYIVYRAMVRAKVAYMRASQAQDAAARQTQIAEGRDYLHLAQRCAAVATPAIVITHGPTGSGKTTGSRDLVESMGAVRIRTDVERKRLHGLQPDARSGSALNAGLYSAAQTERTYAAIAAHVRAVVSAGYPVIADGTFLRADQRQRFRMLAAELQAPFAIVDFAAPPDTLRARVERRRLAARDASEADVDVLEHQLQTAEALTASERARAVTCAGDTQSVHRRLLDVLALRDQVRHG
jgi:aminoglycoside phosphotransferase family enzyme/predicted kinase